MSGEGKPASLKAAYDRLVAATEEKVTLSTRQRRARTVARLAAIQALYQMEMSGAGAEDVIAEFTEHRFDRDMEGETLAEADETFFRELL